MNFSTEHRCTYCDKKQDRNTEHDIFFQCTSLREEKTKWIEKLRAALSNNSTPPNLREAIFKRVYNCYELNLRDSNKISNFVMDHSYDSQSNSAEIAPIKREQRRIIAQDSTTNTDDESSLSSNTSQLLHSRGQIIHRKDVTSSDSKEVYFETAIIDSTLPSNPILIEPFHQNLNPNSSDPTKKLLDWRMKDETS